jgi:peptidyl-prolyl cis-trans isomerase SurA
MIKPNFKSFLIIALIWSGFAFGQDYLNDKRTLLTIDDDKVSVAEFLRVYNKNNVQGEVLDKKSVDEYLDLYVKFKLKVKQAEDLGMDTVKEFIDELNGYRKQLTKPYFIDEEVNEALLKEAYDRKLSDIRASHILIRVDENATAEDTLEAWNKINEIRSKALAGEDFGELAVDNYEDPSARDMTDQSGEKVVRKGNKGDLGYFTVFDMVYPFENAAYGTPKGEVSDIIRTRFGYHILKIEDKKEAMGTAKVAHIFMRINEPATAEDSVKAEANIREAYKELQEGKAFEDVVTKYSEDKGSKEKGGELPPFGSNRMVPEFIYQIDQLKSEGDYTEPFLTSYGWHIVKLIEMNRPGTFDEEKEELNKRIKRDARSHKSEEAVIKKIKQDYKFRKYEKNIQKLYEVVDTNLLNAEWDIAKAEGMTKPVFKIGKVKYTQYDFAKYLADKQKKEKPKSVESYFNKALNDYIDESCVKYLDERLEEIYPEFGLLMKEYKDGILLFELTDDKVWSKAVNDSSGLESYYSEHKDNYMWGDRVKVSIVTIKDYNSYDTLTSIFGENASLDIFTDTSIFIPDNIKIKEKKFSRGENNMIDQMDWEPGYFGIDTLGNDALIYYIEETLEPQVKTLEESRGLVIADYQSELEKQWIRDLKDKYEVDINERVLEAIKEDY